MGGASERVTREPLDLRTCFGARAPTNEADRLYADERNPGPTRKAHRQKDVGGMGVGKGEKTGGIGCKKAIDDARWMNAEWERRRRRSCVGVGVRACGHLPVRSPACLPACVPTRLVLASSVPRLLGWPLHRQSRPYSPACLIAFSAPLPSLLILVSLACLFCRAVVPYQLPSGRL